MAIKKKSLIERWSQDQLWMGLYPEVIARLQTNGELGQLALPQYDGRWDLRGISLRVTGAQVPGEIELPEGMVFRFALGARPRFTNIQLRSIDFSYAQLDQAVFEHCYVEDVLFHNANGEGVTDPGSTFRNVDLSGARWRGATLGFDGTRYEAVNFQRSDLRNTLYYRGYFVDCDFSDANIQNVDFLASHFIRCRFGGKLRKVWFRGYYPGKNDEERFGKTESNPMEDVDFAEAVFTEDVVFANNIDLSRVIPPQDGKHKLFRNWQDTILLARQEVEQEWEGVFRREALRNIDYIFAVQKRKMNIENLDFIERLLVRYFPNPGQAKEFAQAFIDLLLRSAAIAEEKTT
ncbi:MAG: pentapeptide repeat-containing protein [Caldilineaceae bacterium]